MNNKTIKVGIIGATGFAGVELCRILSGHPLVELHGCSSTSFIGQEIAEVYPALSGVVEQTLTSAEEVLERCDIIFASLPHGLSQELAETCDDMGKVFIDLGADFRLAKEEEYKQWYGEEFKNQDLHKKAVYGLPELYSKEISRAKLIANPGCYPTSVILGLAPLAKANIIKADSIIIDAKSGVTGAGRTPSSTTHFVACNEGLAPYKIGEHRHTPEMEQVLGWLSGEDMTITFTPHLMPVNRGILSTIYVRPNAPISLEEVKERYDSFYKDKHFVKVLPLGSTANSKNVSYSNYCHISLHQDKRTGRIVVVSAIDNIVKGASGQAVQNMNILCGFPEETGLTMIPPAF